MKRIVIAIISVGMLFAACEKDTPTTGNQSYPTDGLTVENKQRVLVMEQTGAWCQFCPNGAATMVELVAFYEDAIVPIAVHSGDALTAPISGIWDNNFPASGVPNFYVMNEDAGQAPQNKISGYLNQIPFVGITHAIETTDSSWNVYPKLQVFEASFNEDYLINSYLILDAVLAKDYGSGIDLNQISSVPIAGGVNPTKWLQDAAFVDGEPQIRAGDDYYHTESLVGVANTFNPFGLALADFNPFGNEYIDGDILGTKNTPILLSIPRVSIAPFETEISIVTIVWRLRTDGSGAFDYVNGYMSHHVAN